MTRGMGEDVLQSHVLEMCKSLGLLAYHTFDSRRSVPGFPDLVIVGQNGVLYRELKRRNGKVRRDQVHWLVALRVAGQDADVWRPEDWQNASSASSGHSARSRGCARLLRRLRSVGISPGR
jgi:hypothetical protein